MPYVRIPFPQTDQTDEGHRESGCPVCSALSPELSEQAQQHPHLLRYLHMVSTGEHGIPEYHEKLERKMGDVDQPNIIYPVGNATFAHIYPDAQDARNSYIPVEPIVGSDYGSLMETVEDRLVDVVHKLKQPSSPEEQEEVLLEALSQIATVDGHHGNGGSASQAEPKSRRRGVLKLPGNHKLKLTEEKLAAVRYLLLRDKVGMGILQPLILDTNIEDISCSGLGPIFVEHKVFKALKAAIIFDQLEDLDAFLRRASERINKPVTYRRPIVDATLCPSGVATSPSASSPPRP
jgi:flagellar protein FlaI